MSEELIARFWTHVNKNGPIPIQHPELGSCWLWTGANPDGRYGRFRGEGRRQVGAHRFSYELEYGPIPDERPIICHHCDNPPCVRPSHLFAGTVRDNADDMMAKGRSLCRSLTLEQAEEIHRIYTAGGISLRARARQYGVRHNTIYGIVRGRLYRVALQAAA
jgi:hypothetical protein